MGPLSFRICNQVIYANSAAGYATSNKALNLEATGISELMSSSKDGEGAAGGQKGPAAGKAGDPEWASGLKKLYDSVVDEPLPDTFKDLLSKLDEPGEK